MEATRVQGMKVGCAEERTQGDHLGRARSPGLDLTCLLLQPPQAPRPPAHLRPSQPRVTFSVPLPSLQLLCLEEQKPARCH